MFSLPDRLVAWFAACIVAAIPALAQGGFELRFERLDAAGLTLRDVRVAAQRFDGGPAQVSVARAVISGRTYRQIRLECADFRALPDLRCHGGQLRARDFGPWPVDFALRGPQRALDARVQIPSGPTIDIAGELAGIHPQLTLRAAGIDLAGLGKTVPGLDKALAAYTLHGSADVDLTVEDFVSGNGPSLTLRMRLAGAGFASEDGLRAAENLGLVIEASAAKAGESWRGRLSADWREGELLWDSVYLRGGATALATDATLTGSGLALRNGRLDLAGVGRLDLEGDAGLDVPSLRRATVRGMALDLAALNARFIAPLLAAKGWPALTLGGLADVEFDLDEDGLSRGRIALTDAALADAGDRWEVRGVMADLPWSRDGASTLTASVSSARYGRIPLAAFALQAERAPGRLSLKPVRIPVLDAGLRLNLLKFVQDGPRWRGDLSFDLEPVSMPLLSEALGLPRMAGSLGATVPHVSWRDGVLALDGQMLIVVFDGYVSATGLKLIEPFSATPRVLADLQMRYIDLEALTDTVKFGRITGRIDGDIKGVELLNWRPQAFDAHIRSSPGDYPRVISQRAVQNITALGGPGAAAAIQRSFLGFFERFGYRRMGVSCRLRDGVCLMDGLAPKGDGFVLIEGGGIPALGVVGYNRRVNWQLLDRLARVTDAKPVVE